ncbi:MAG: AAA family ATPase, partial [Bacteroidaceae bacterium]|nr:AAA family ATPase [Bacteroidaceae bacterium]
NFKNTIIIMTSNLGSDYIRQQFSHLTPNNRSQLIEETQHTVMELLKQQIKPEFLNRIDETIMFLPLTRDEIRQVVQLQVDSVCSMLKENGVSLHLTPEAVLCIVDAGYDPEYGARPVKRAIQTLLLNELSRRLLALEVEKDKPVFVDADGHGGLVFRNEE